MTLRHLALGFGMFAGIITSHEARAQDTRREIVVIGTVHEATPRFSAERLRQLLDRIKPDLILLELDPSFFDSTGTLIERFRAVSLESRVAVAYAAATSRVALRPFDIDGRNRFYQENDYFAREVAFNQSLRRLHASGELVPEAKVLYEALLGFGAVRDACGAALPELMNAAPCDSAIARKHHYAFKGFSRIVTLTPALAEFSSFTRMADEFWTRRSAAMVANILAQVSKASRVVVLTGFEHRVQLRRELALQAGTRSFTLRDMAEY